MADLRALFADLGFTDVATLLNSRNVVFTAGKVAADLAEIVRENPLLDIAREHARLIVTDLSDRSIGRSSSRSRDPIGETSASHSGAARCTSGVPRAAWRANQTLWSANFSAEQTRAVTWRRSSNCNPSSRANLQK